MTYRLDPTHMRLRFTVLLVMALAFVIGLVGSIIVLARMPLDSLLRVSMVAMAALGMSLGSGWLAERLLTQHWPSGRTLQLAPDGITLQERSGEKIAIQWGSRINILSWRFVIRKGRAWVPKGSYCLACQIRQDDKVIIPYAFVKPSAAERVPQLAAFEELLPRKSSSKEGQEHRLGDIGGQAQLRYAERDRWFSGAEMLPDDFMQLIAEIQQRVPDWLP